MRYLSSVSNPLAHYWEEDLTGIWGAWIRLRFRSQRTASLFIDELVFANIFLFWEILLGHSLFSPLTRILSIRIGKIHLNNIVKRTIDIIGALFGLIISAPVWIIIPLAIKLDSRGPVLYSQTRVGLNRRKNRRRNIAIEGGDRRSRDDRRRNQSFGRPFEIYKFRTMVQDAEQASGPVWAKQNDPRITKLGRFLRKTRIDEIPQLVNVLRGDMSLVGPRPERPFFVEKLDGIIENYRDRFQTKPGVTGLAQVEHKYDESLEDVNGKIKYDLTYIRNWNVFEDIRIMLKTVIVVLTARGM